MKLVSKDVVTVGEASNLELIVDSDKHLYADENTSFELVATGSAKLNDAPFLAGHSTSSISNLLSDKIVST